MITVQITVLFIKCNICCSSDIHYTCNTVLCVCIKK